MRPSLSVSEAALRPAPFFDHTFVFSCLAGHDNSCPASNTITVECSASASQSTHTESLPDADCDGIAEGNCNDGTCINAAECDDAPTLIQLSDLSVTPLNSRVRISWTTAAEIDNAGFNIYRAAEGGGYVKINASLIPAEGSPTVGASYDGAHGRHRRTQGRNHCCRDGSCRRSWGNTGPGGIELAAPTIRRGDPDYRRPAVVAVKGQSS